MSGAPKSGKKPSRAARGSRRGLTRDIIARLALNLVDSRGIEALTMRSLARACEVEAMSLYAHFSDKDALLGAVAAAATDCIELPDEAASPRTRLVLLSRAFRNAAHAHPNAFPLVVLHPLKLDSALRPVECALRAFIEAGLSPRSAVTAQRTLLGFVRGYSLWELGGFNTGRRPQPGARPQKEVTQTLTALDDTAFRSVRLCTKELLEYDPDAEFDSCVSTLLDAARVPASSRRRPKVRKVPDRAP
jgi:AcrR family transcriptional regulator